MDSPALNLTDPSNFSNGFPHEFFSWLREHDPVYWHPPAGAASDNEGFWVISRYADVAAIINNPRDFSSDKAAGRSGGGTTIVDERTAGKVLNQTDDPYHRRLRALVNKGFTIKAVAALEDELRRRAEQLISGIRVGEHFDFATRISREIPTQAICTVLGVPEEKRYQLCEWIDRGIAAPSDEVIAVKYARLVRDYAQTLIDEKRARPSNDIFSSIVHAEFEADGSSLADNELKSFFGLLFPAGAETTTRAISGGMLALIENPGQWRALKASPQSIKTAVEEIVRWTTPSVYKRRTASRDVEFHGRSITAGDKVTFWEMSANRDARVFERPFEFDIARSPNKHLGFGAGIHFCLGASLARLELTVVFESLVAAGLEFELAGEPLWVPNNRLVGLKSLPVKLVERSH